MKKSILAAFVTFSALAFAQEAGAQASEGKAGNAFTDQFVINFSPTSRSGRTLDAADLVDIKNKLHGLGFIAKFLRTTATGGHLFKLDRFAKNKDLSNTLAAYAAMSADILSVEPDPIGLPLQATYNDPFYPYQWDLGSGAAGVDAITAWPYATGVGVAIGIIDTGVLPHSDLTLVAGYDFVGDPNSSNDGNGRDSDASDPGSWRVTGQCPSPLAGAQVSTWHGTAVAGVAASGLNNYVGGIGVAPNAVILPLRVTGACGAYSSDIADAIVWGAGGAS